MNKAYEKLVRCEKIIREKTDFEPEVALVLGSGLGGYASNMDVRCEVPYSEIEGFPVSTVPGHDGRFLFGYVKGVPVVAMKGRIHYYEGYDMTDIVLPIRLMGMLGAKTLVLTNAAGGINMDFTPGDLMIIKDHISAFVPSPLRGENLDELGPRFPDMSKIYDRGLMEYLRASAAENGFEMREGVYLQFQGPNFETRPRRGRRWNEYGVRGHSRKAYGPENRRGFLHNQHGCGNFRPAAFSRGGSGDGGQSRRQV